MRKPSGLSPLSNHSWGAHFINSTVSLVPPFGATRSMAVLDAVANPVKDSAAAGRPQSIQATVKKMVVIKNQFCTMKKMLVIKNKFYTMKKMLVHKNQFSAP